MANVVGADVVVGTAVVVGEVGVGVGAAVGAAVGDTVTVTVALNVGGSDFVTAWAVAIEAGSMAMLATASNTPRFAAAACTNVPKDAD